MATKNNSKRVPKNGSSTRGSDKPKDKGTVNAGKETITIQHPFTPAELEEKGQMLANAVAKKKTIEEEKKNVMKEYSLKIDQKKSEIDILSSAITNKYEMQTVTAQVTLDFNVQKKFFMHDGQIVKQEPLSKADYQLRIETETPATLSLKKTTTENKTDK